MLPKTKFNPMESELVLFPAGSGIIPSHGERSRYTAASYCYLHGKIVPLAEAKIGVMTHALHYGTALFEGIRGNWNADKKQLYIFRAKEHFERLLTCQKIPRWIKICP